MMKLLENYKFDLKNFNKPMYGTCAGLVVLQKLGLIDIKATRNAYGRQIDSFKEDVDFEGVGKIPAVFIRAPVIDEVGDGVEILSKHNNEIIAAKQGNILVTTFHPELTDDLRIHEYFIKQHAVSR